MSTLIERPEPRPRARALPLLLLPLLVVSTQGCGDTPAAPVGEAQVESPDTETASAGIFQGLFGRDARTRGIHVALEEWIAAWNDMDATAYAAAYTVDADFVNPLGGIVTGRETIRQVHQGLFAGPFAGSTSSYEVRRLVFLGLGLALVDLNVTLTGFVATPPGLPQVTPGVVLTRHRQILVRKGLSWEIASQQITGVQP